MASQANLGYEFIVYVHVCVYIFAHYCAKLFCACRLKIISVLMNFLRSVIALSPDETATCVKLCLNKVISVIHSSSSISKYRFSVEGYLP